MVPGKFDWGKQTRYGALYSICFSSSTNLFLSSDYPDSVPTIEESRLAVKFEREKNDSRHSRGGLDSLVQSVTNSIAALIGGYSDPVQRYTKDCSIPCAS